jgi:hypothetical protein
MEEYFQVVGLVLAGVIPFTQIPDPLILVPAVATILLGIRANRTREDMSKTAADLAD